jgi:hypothetical protein
MEVKTALQQVVSPAIKAGKSSISGLRNTQTDEDNILIPYESTLRLIYKFYLKGDTPDYASVVSFISNEFYI